LAPISYRLRSFQFILQFAETAYFVGDLRACLTIAETKVHFVSGQFVTIPEVREKSVNLTFRLIQNWHWLIFPVRICVNDMLFHMWATL